MKIRSKEMNDILREMVSALVAVIEETDPGFQGRPERVASHCASFSGKKGLLKRDEIEDVYFAGLLYDVGMVNIPLEIIQKHDELTKDEDAMVREHPKISVKILSNFTMLNSILPIVRHHHEAFDGSGYPDGLVGDEIPLGARILCLADTYDTLTSASPHGPAMSMEEALEKVIERGGTQFDKNLVNRFVEYIESIKGKTKIIKIISDTADQEKRELQDIIEEIVHKFNKGKIDPPVLPHVVQEIQDIINNKTSTPEDLAAAIEKDAVVSLRLISVANSPLYRGVEDISTVRRAVPRLGLKQTENIVSTIAHKGMYDIKHAKFKALMERLWLHSLATAYGAKAIAKALAFGDTEEYFMMGLTHDIGKTILIKALTEILKSVSIKASDAIESIHQLHCDFGGAVLKRWKFSEDFVSVATLHEGLQFSSETKKGVLVVNLANNLTRNIGYSLFEEEVELSELKSTELLGIDADALNAIGENVKEQMKDSGQLF